MVESLVLLPLSVQPGRLVRPAEGDLHRLSGASMGTRWSLTIAGAIDTPAVAALVQTELDAVVGEMSQWEAGSELSRFNRAPAGSWVPVSPGFFEVAAAGVDIAERTGGAFDPTIGALVDLWGFGPVGPAIFPPETRAIHEARTRSGWTRLALDEQNRRILQPGGLELDLSGIAKGHAVDRAAKALERAGQVSFLLEIGGELVARGVKPDGHPWWVDLERPPSATLPPIRVGLFEAAIATSGDYRRRHEHGGARLAHTLDPKTGAPLVNPPASVTVLHDQCMRADALATALTVLGVEAGLALADADQIAAIFLYPEDGGWRRALSARARAMAEA